MTSESFENHHHGGSEDARVVSFRACWVPVQFKIQISRVHGSPSTTTDDGEVLVDSFVAMRRPNFVDTSSTVAVADDHDLPREKKRRRSPKSQRRRSIAIVVSSSLAALLLVFYLSSSNQPATSPLRRDLTVNTTNATTTVRPLRPIDREFYTVRINTWQRPDQLRISVDHHLSCPGVVQVQVVWCTAQGPPPDWLSESNAVVEEHEHNSLNERFFLLNPSPTYGIFHVDDDVLRPCLALDAAFFRWTDHPDRMVGMDARTHVSADGGWKYGYMSTTQQTNRYSLTLTRAAFVHVDYMESYGTALPAEIRKTVDEHLNCEDIAMSLWVSSWTNGQVPLLADAWAMKSMVKLYSKAAISGSKGHKAIRDHCVDRFAELLDLKSRLKAAKLEHSEHRLFECGDRVPNVHPPDRIRRREALEAQIALWKHNSTAMNEDLAQARYHMSMPAFHAGLLEGTSVWKERYLGQGQVAR